MKIISWNVNGIRAVIRKGAMDEFLNKHDPDILCLQETKAMKEQVNVDFKQYEEYWHSAEKKGYSGTAIFSKQTPLSVSNALLSKINLVDEADRDAAKEGRIVTAEFENYYVISVYVPNAKDDLSRIPLRKNGWDKALLQHVKKLQKKKPVVLCGDFNVAHQPIDLARPRPNEGKKGFTAEEREGMNNFLAAGMIDTFREQHPDEPDHYSWWSHWGKARERNVGWRIDYVLASTELKNNIEDSFILPEVIGSDHCPVGVTMK